MTKYQQEDFVKENKNKKLRKSNWSEGTYFIPDGRLHSHVIYAEQQMIGTYYCRGIAYRDMQYPIENGFEQNALGNYWKIIIDN